MEVVTLTTNRLRLRPWCEADRAPFAAINADPVAMEFFPSMLSRQESDAMVDRIVASFSERGWGLWAVDVLPAAFDAATSAITQTETDDRCGKEPPTGFIGYVGLAVPRFESHFMPCVEIGWRLARHAWGHGFATEAARAVIQFGFESLKLPEIVSFTATSNERSWRVMERLGMTRDPNEDFEHPALPVGHRLRRHVLYRLKNPAVVAGRSV